MQIAGLSPSLTAARDRGGPSNLIQDSGGLSQKRIADTLQWIPVNGVSLHLSGIYQSHGGRLRVCCVVFLGVRSPVNDVMEDKKYIRCEVH